MLSNQASTSQASRRIRYALGFAALCCASFAHADSFQFSGSQSLTFDTRPDALAIADLDGDGHDDLLVTGTYPTQELFVFFQGTDGTLLEPISIPYGGTTPWNTSFAVGDFDNDAISDVLIGHNNGYSLLKGNASRILDAQLVPAPENLDVLPIDIDLDGNLDFLMLENGTALDTYRGDGSGTFTLSGQSTINSSGTNYLKLGKLDSNGSPDLALSNGTDQLFLYMQRRRGFDSPPQTITTDYSPFWTGGVAIGDFNHDGRNDVVTGKASNSPTIISIYYGAAQGGFLAPVTLPTLDIPGVMVAGDIDGDGKDDLLVGHDGWGKVGLYLQGDSGLGSETLYSAPTGRNAHSIAYGDLDHDGCNDAAVANKFGVTVLYGTGCQRPADLADMDVEAILRSLDASILINNRSGSAPLASPLVDVTISSGRGEVEIATIPEACVLKSQNRRSRSYECLIDTLNPGDSASLDFAYVANRDHWNVIGLFGKASTDTPESDTSNNFASTSLALPPAPLTAGSKPGTGARRLAKPGGAKLNRVKGR